MVIAVWASVATTLLFLLVIRNRKTNRKINEILEKILDGQQVDEIPFDESAVSLFSHQLKMLANKLEFEIGRADAEKEQIKQLISNMSHQLKTPLANILMYEELLECGSLPEEQRVEFLRRLKVQSEKIQWLLESLFKMSRLEQNVIEFDLVETGIRETLRDAIGVVYDKAEKKRIDICVADFEDIMLLHNPRWTSEVIVNLLENAVKYTADSGRIEISIERLETYSIIHVRDNGMGIAKEEIPYIFNRFYRGRQVDEMEGTGIGLYLSKLILEKEKGYMTVTSEVGRGSVFSVFLQNC